MRWKLLLLLTILFFNPLFSEVQIGSISTLLYEYYDEANLIYNENGDKNKFIPISKYLISLTPQLIWRSDRNTLILNIELFGSLGSLDGSFGKDGKLEGQLKADSFYKGYYKDSPVYIKFGKYPGDLPFALGSQVTSGQAELGVDTNTIDFFYSALFYNTFNTLLEDGSYIYENEKYRDDNRVIQIIGCDLSLGANKLKIRLPLNTSNSSFCESIYPSINHTLFLDFIDINSFIGLAYRSDTFSLSIREELSFIYKDFKTSLLFAHLTANNDIDKNYKYTSIDNSPLEFHYGSHFNYLYQQAGNIYGLNSIGLKQSYIKGMLSLWISASSHLSIKQLEIENREDNFIGSIFSIGLKFNNFWSENTLLEIYSSLFKPEGFSVINSEQTLDHGFQLIVKLQHVIF